MVFLYQFLIAYHALKLFVDPFALTPITPKANGTYIDYRRLYYQKLYKSSL